MEDSTAPDNSPTSAVPSLAGTVTVASYSPETCGVCLNEYSDPRVLDCLHSFCRLCIEQMIITADSDGIVCPLCRTLTKLPHGKTDELAKDVSLPVPKVSTSCILCSSDEAVHKAGVSSPAWQCAKCKTALCDHHIVVHTKTCGSHQINVLSSRDYEQPHATISSCSLCHEHGEPLQFFCPTCGTAVCGDCITVGSHSDHKPIRRLKDVVTERQEKTVLEVENMRENLIPEVQRSIAAVDEVICQLTTHTEQVRVSIQTAGQQAVNAVQVCVQQKLQQVDDIEATRRKLLHQQRSELKSHLDCMQNAVTFSERLRRAQETSDQLPFLVFALESRLTDLTRTEITHHPVQHAMVAFGPTDDHVTRADRIVGDVLPCLASATHSQICWEDEDEKKARLPGETVKCTVQVKDSSSEPLRNRGDVVTAKWHQTPLQSDQCPLVLVNNQRNGQHIISFVVPHPGDYLLNVLINGERSPTCVRVTCKDSRKVKFDCAQCHSNIAVASHQQSVTLRDVPCGESAYDHSVLGLPVMRHGQYSWKVMVVFSTEIVDTVIGVIRKPLLLKKKNISMSYSWYSGDDKYCGSDTCIPTGLNRWQTGSLLQFDLDCDNSTLTMRNVHSGEVDKITDLPQEELFPYFALYSPGDTIELIP